MTGMRLPSLHVGTLIQGTQADIGSWGDGKVYVVDLWGTCFMSPPHTRPCAAPPSRR